MRGMIEKQYKLRFCEVNGNLISAIEDEDKIYTLKEIVDLLNKKDVRIKELESENKMLKTTISRNEAYIKRVTTKGKWNNTGDVK